MAAINTVFYSGLRLRNRTIANLEEKLPMQRTVATIQRTWRT